MDSETFNFNMKNPYALPNKSRATYGTEFEVIQPLEANADGLLQPEQFEYTFPLRHLNSVYSFSRDTGFRVTMALQRQEADGSWAKVQESDGKHLFLRNDFMEFFFANTKLMAYDRPVLHPSEGYQNSNGLLFAALKSFLDEKFLKQEYPMTNDLVKFNSWDKSKYKLASTNNDDNAYQKLFEQFYTGVDRNGYGTFFYSPSIFPFFQQSIGKENNVGVFSVLTKDAADRRLHIKTILPDLEKKTCFGYLGSANPPSKYRFKVTRLELIVKRGLLLDSFVKTIPREIKYNLLRFKTFHKSIKGTYNDLFFDFYDVYFPSSILVFCTSKYALSVDQALGHDAQAQASDSFKDIKLKSATFWFDSVKIISGEENGPLNFREKDMARNHIYRCFQSNAFTEDPKQAISMDDYFNQEKNRFLHYFMPLNATGTKTGGSFFYNPKESFSATRFTKRSDAKLKLDIGTQEFTHPWEIIVYFFYPIELSMNLAKMSFENPIV